MDVFSGCFVVLGYYSSVMDDCTKSEKRFIVVGD